MGITLPLAQMSLEEKLRVMEELWDDLTHKHSEFPSPAWHEDVLKLREEALRSGQDEFVDWETAKKQLRDRQV